MFYLRSSREVVSFSKETQFSFYYVLSFLSLSDEEFSIRQNIKLTQVLTDETWQNN